MPSFFAPIKQSPAASHLLTLDLGRRWLQSRTTSRYLSFPSLCRGLYHYPFFRGVSTINSVVRQLKS